MMSKTYTCPQRYAEPDLLNSMEKDRFVDGKCSHCCATTADAEHAQYAPHEPPVLTEVVEEPAKPTEEGEQHE
jgi:hypothetical protein